MTEPIFVSVDVETAGPYPGAYSLLSIGACDVDSPERSFECQLKPDRDRFDPAALAVTGLSLDRLRAVGLAPAEAMGAFAAWLETLGASDAPRIFVGFNAAFDWAFINHYFLEYVGANPFGFSALDIKAYYMGVTGCVWADTRSSVMARQLQPLLVGDHDALHDALFQAELFRLARSHRAGV